MDIGKSRLSADCPACHSPVEFTLSQAAEGASVKCAGCGATIRLTDDGSTSKAVSDVNGKLDEISKAIKKISK